MNIERILTKINQFDFNKLQRCIVNPHSSGIGLWAYWWLGLNPDGVVLDPSPSVKYKRKERKADLVFCTSLGRRVGILEFENTYSKFKEKADTLFYYDMNKNFSDLKFGILVTWMASNKADFGKDESDKKNSHKAVNDVKRILKNYSTNENSKIRYILYNTYLDLDKENKLYNFREVTSNFLKDFECVIYYKGKEKYLKKLNF